MGLHWGFTPLEYLVPAEILNDVKATQVDPHVPTGVEDRLPSTMARPAI